MSILTNEVGIIIAEIDSGGALRSAGDRVILGARSSSSEKEWVVRQKVAECSARMTECVHRNGGIVARKAAESIFSTFPAPESAFKAACEIQRTHVEAALSITVGGATTAAPLGLRVGLSYGQMVVDAGAVSGDPIYVAGQIAGKASAGQIMAADSIVRTLGSSLQGCAKSLGSMKFDDLQAEVEVFEISWDRVPVPRAGASAAPPGKPAPKLRIQSRGKEIVLDDAHRTVTLRSGKERTLHARIEYRDEQGFFLINLRPDGTRVKLGGSAESLCRGELALRGDGAISLGTDFREGAPEVLKFSRVG